MALRPKEGAAAGPPGRSAERRRFGWPASPSPAPPVGVEVQASNGTGREAKARRSIDDWRGAVAGEAQPRTNSKATTSPAHPRCY